MFFAANCEKNAEQPDWLDRTPEETARRRRIDQSLDDQIDAVFARFDIIDEEVDDEEIVTIGNTPSVT